MKNQNKLKWVKLEHKEIVKHTKPLIQKNKKKYNRKLKENNERKKEI